MLFPQEKRDGENVVTGTGDDHSVSSLQRPKVEIRSPAAGQDFEETVELAVFGLRHLHGGASRGFLFPLGRLVIHETGVALKEMEGPIDSRKYIPLGGITLGDLVQGY